MLSNPPHPLTLAVGDSGIKPADLAWFAIALFDQSGIWEGCESYGQAPSQHWVEAAFHTIGLTKLLRTSLRQQNFEFAKASSTDCTTFILRRRYRYVAIVTQPLTGIQAFFLGQQLRSLELTDLVSLVRSPSLLSLPQS